MSKQSIQFSCTGCEKKYLKWQGNCSACGLWNSISESIIAPTKKINILSSNVPIPIDDIVINDKNYRYVANIHEWDSVLGGGMICNSVILLAGMPGIGKSTLLLQLASTLSKGHIVLYISSEESVQQIKLRAERLNIKNIKNLLLLSETKAEHIIAAIESINPAIVFLDSLQNLLSEEGLITNHIGKIKNVVNELTNHAKQNNYVLLCTCHVTKDGEIAGPKAIEHIVDVVLYIEGEPDESLRIIRSTKNRFGSTHEAGFFTLNEKGIEECKDPQALMINHAKPSIGAALTWYREGSRTFLIEIQTLINKSRLPAPQRIIQGIEQKQLILMCAVLEKYLKIPLYEFDLFCKVSGNVKLRGVHSDCALALSLISSYYNIPINDVMVFSGEIGLSGDVIAVNDSFLSHNSLFDRYSVKKIITGVKEKGTTKNNLDNAQIKRITELLQFIKKTN